MMDSHCANYFLEALYSLTQMYTVDEFYLRIDNLMNLVLDAYPGMEENYFISRFIQGLQHEIQVYVLQGQPTTLLDAYELALVQEYALNYTTKKASIVQKEETMALVVAELEDTTTVVVVSTHDGTFHPTLPRCITDLPSNASKEVSSVGNHVAGAKMATICTYNVDAHEAMMVRSFTTFGKLDIAAYRVESESFVPHHIPREVLVPQRLVATDNTAAVSGFSIEDQGDIRDKGGTHHKALWPCAKNSNTPYLILCVHSTPWRSLLHVSSLPFGPVPVKVWDKQCQCPGMFFIFTLFVVSVDIPFSVMCAVGAQSHMSFVVSTMEHTAEALMDPTNVIVGTKGL